MRCTAEQGIAQSHPLLSRAHPHPMTGSVALNPRCPGTGGKSGLVTCMSGSLPRLQPACLGLAAWPPGSLPGSLSVWPPKVTEIPISIPSLTLRPAIAFLE